MPNTAICIYAEAGEVKTNFCTEEEALVKMKQCEIALCFISDHHFDQELMLSVSPELREKVAQAKRKVQQRILLMAELDKHGVPPDRQLRADILLAVDSFLNLQ